MTKQEERQLRQDQKIASILLSWFEDSINDDMPYNHNPRVKAVWGRVEKVAAKKAAWMNKANPVPPPEVEVDFQDVMKNKQSYLEDLEQRYGV